MDFETTEALRDRHAAWRLLRAGNASLVLSFLGRFFVEANRGPTAAAEVVAALEDDLYGLNAGARPDEQRFPKTARAYLDDWSATDAGFLRRFYPAGDDEVHYEVTPAFEKAFAWVESLQVRPFVGTESRLHTVVALLRQIVHGSETDPQVRLAELHRQRAEIEKEIRQVEAGVVTTLEPTGVRDRYQQAAGVARELLADFRQVEENFRDLDRAAREKIASWAGSKGELLDDLVGGRMSIAASDQGRSFQAFHDFLLSEARQEELAQLLAAVQELDAVEADSRFRTVHHDWSEAAERTQRTVRQISEQLRRFLDERVWLENRRVVDLVRLVEAAALEVRSRPPGIGLEVDEPGIEIALPFERPLYDARPVSEVDSLLPPAVAEELSTEAMFVQTFIDQARLAANIRTLVPERSSANLEDILAWYPIEQGAAELIGYLALQDNDIEIDMNDTDETVIEWKADEDTTRRARMPKVTVRRR